MENNTGKKDRFVREWNAFIKSGDMDSLGLVYDSYFDLLFNYGRKFHFESQLIEDAIQNVFISLINVRKKLEGVENVTSYLFYSFRNELFKISAKEKKIRLDDATPQFFISPDNNKEEEIIKTESDSRLSSILNRYIKKLTPSQQEILYMRYDANLSYDDISRILNISIESCRTAVYRAVKSLKQDLLELKRHGVTLHFLYLVLFPVLINFFLS